MKIGSSTFPKLAFALFALAFTAVLSCRNPGTDTQTEGEATAETASTNESPIGSRQAYVPPRASQNPLTLGFSSARVKSGELVCLDVQTANFNALLSMQYSVKWDPALLQFKSVQGFRLPGLGPEDFGAHRTAEGILTAVWIDENLQGITVNDGDTVYQICFQAIGASGQRAEVNLSDGPTPFEVVNLKEEVVGLEGVAGRVTIQ